MTKILKRQYLLGIHLLISNYVGNSDSHVTPRSSQVLLVALVLIIVSDFRLFQLVEGKSSWTYRKCSSYCWRMLVLVVFLVLVLVVVEGF
jgi:hypothetical protein